MDDRFEKGWNGNRLSLSWGRLPRPEGMLQMTETRADIRNRNLYNTKTSTLPWRSNECDVVVRIESIFMSWVRFYTELRRLKQFFFFAVCSLFDWLCKQHFETFCLPALKHTSDSCKPNIMSNSHYAELILGQQVIASHCWLLEWSAAKWGNPRIGLWDLGFTLGWSLIYLSNYDTVCFGRPFPAFRGTWYCIWLRHYARPESRDFDSRWAHWEFLLT